MGCGACGPDNNNKADLRMYQALESRVLADEKARKENIREERKAMGLPMDEGGIIFLLDFSLLQHSASVHIAGCFRIFFVCVPTASCITIKHNYCGRLASFLLRQSGVRCGATVCHIRKSSRSRSIMSFQLRSFSNNDHRKTKHIQTPVQPQEKHRRHCCSIDIHAPHRSHPVLILCAISCCLLVFFLFSSLVALSPFRAFQILSPGLDVF